MSRFPSSPELGPDAGASFAARLPSAGGVSLTARLPSAAGAPVCGVVAIGLGRRRNAFPWSRRDSRRYAETAAAAGRLVLVVAAARPVGRRQPMPTRRPRPVPASDSCWTSVCGTSVSAGRLRPGCRRIPAGCPGCRGCRRRTSGVTCRRRRRRPFDGIGRRRRRRPSDGIGRRRGTCRGCRPGSIPRRAGRTSDRRVRIVSNLRANHRRNAVPASLPACPSPAAWVPAPASSGAGRRRPWSPARACQMRLKKLSLRGASSTGASGRAGARGPPGDVVDVDARSLGEDAGLHQALVLAAVLVELDAVARGIADLVQVLRFQAADLEMRMPRVPRWAGSGSTSRAGTRSGSVRGASR